jgi:hypothetical protein
VRFEPIERLEPFEQSEEREEVMTKQSHKHYGGRTLHKDWRAWTALVLMLAAIVIYVLTLDDSIVPR